MRYDGWCRRIDLELRARYPFLNTRIFRIGEHEYQIFIVEKVDNFSEIVEVFEKKIKIITTPVKLVNREPEIFQEELKGISDFEIPSDFEGFPLSKFQIYNYLSSRYPSVDISNVYENHEEKKIVVELVGAQARGDLIKIQDTANALKGVYSYEVKDRGVDAARWKPTDIVFNIVSSSSVRDLNCPFLERDERLWFENVENIYKGEFGKRDLYFFDPKKASCLVNFSRFQNANLRNHLLLYDTVYCVLPLAEDMDVFFADQKITRDELLHLVERNRLIILNMQPEVRMDYGFLREAYEANPVSVVSRRALSTLCAIDLVDLNRTYILSDPELVKLTFSLIKELAEIFKKDVDSVSDFLLWPKKALRYSLDTLTETGPMGIARYGVNGPIIKNISQFGNLDQGAIEFEFTVNSDQIHLAHALDATYFPFFVGEDKYSDHPYAVMMGAALNFFKSANFENLNRAHHVERLSNPTIDLISLFDINSYIPLREFEAEISSSVIRQGMNSLFSELSKLNANERNRRVAEYNLDVKEILNRRGMSKIFLDLGGDALGEIIPFLSSIVKGTESATRKAMNKFPAIQALSECIEDRTSSSNERQRHISMLSKINRVARLRDV